MAMRCNSHSRGERALLGSKGKSNRNLMLPPSVLTILSITTAFLAITAIGGAPQRMKLEAFFPPGCAGGGGQNLEALCDHGST